MAKQSRRPQRIVAAAASARTTIARTRSRLAEQQKTLQRQAERVTIIGRNATR